MTDELHVAAKALREAAADLMAMTTDPFDLLTESVGVKGPIAVALWLQDRADAYGVPVDTEETPGGTGDE